MLTFHTKKTQSEQLTFRIIYDISQKNMLSNVMKISVHEKLIYHSFLKSLFPYIKNYISFLQNIQ